MSTRVGTIQAPRAGRSIWTAAIVATFVMLMIGVAAISLDRDNTTKPEPTFPRGTAANTPTELGAAIEAPAGAGISFVRHLPRHAFPRRALDAAVTEGVAAGSVAGNTPSELRGGMVGWTTADDAPSASERYDLHQRL